MINNEDNLFKTKKVIYLPLAVWIEASGDHHNHKSA